MVETNLPVSRSYSKARRRMGDWVLEAKRPVVNDADSPSLIAIFGEPLLQANSQCPSLSCFAQLTLARALLENKIKINRKTDSAAHCFLREIIIGISPSYF